MKTIRRSLSGSSGLRIGDNSSSSGEPGGVQREWSQPIGMNTKFSRGTGLAGVLSQAVAAGTMASSSGRASDACMPRRNVRRGRAFFVMITWNSSYQKVRS